MEWVVVWMVILAVVLVFEFWALGRKARGDTLSEQIWWLLKRWWGRAILYPLWIWLTYHFFLEPDSVALQAWWDDIALTTVVLCGTLLIGRRKTVQETKDIPE